MFLAYGVNDINEALLSWDAKLIDDTKEYKCPRYSGDTQQIEPTTSNPVVTRSKPKSQSTDEIRPRLRCHLVLTNLFVMLINTFSSNEPCTERYGDEVHDEPGEKDMYQI